MRIQRENPVNFEWTNAQMAAAEVELVERSPGLASLVQGHGPCTLRSRRGTSESHFEALASSIVYQQLAGRAAAAIWTRVRALTTDSFLPEQVVLLEPAALRDTGLSGAKAAALADLAARVAKGALDLNRVVTLDDDDVIARLSEVRGIGRWTAQMFLMFQLGRLDVWPTGDLGVRRGYAVIYGLDEAPTSRALEAQGEAFRPWRSIMAWYCWRALDPVPAPVAPPPAPAGLPDLPTGR